MNDMRERIIDESHMYETSDLAKKYFFDCGFNISELDENHFKKLKDFINKEICILLCDKTYSMVKDLYVTPKIKKDKSGNVNLYADGSYFKGREAISFYTDNHIGFCGWAGGCNRIPFIKGFIEWCDCMMENKVNHGK